MIIFIASKGFLDDIPLNLIKKFETEFFTYVEEKYPEAPKSIAETKAFSGEAMNTLERAATAFKEQFKEKIPLKTGS